MPSKSTRKVRCDASLVELDDGEFFVIQVPGEQLTVKLHDGRDGPFEEDTVAGVWFVDVQQQIAGQLGGSRMDISSISSNVTRLSYYIEYIF